MISNAEYIKPHGHEKINACRISIEGVGLLDGCALILVDMDVCACA